MANEKILVVDDEPEMVRFCVDALTSAGYRVTGVTSPQETLELVKKDFFDLLLVDVMMPGMSGLEMLEAIREFDPDLRAVIITAYGTMDSAVKAVRLRALEFLLKPFDAVELRTTVEKALEKSREERQWRQLSKR